MLTNKPVYRCAFFLLLLVFLLSVLCAFVHAPVAEQEAPPPLSGQARILRAPATVEPGQTALLPESNIRPSTSIRLFFRPYSAGTTTVRRSMKPKRQKRKKQSAT